MTVQQRVGDARVAALDWVATNVAGAQGFVGAYLAGSVATLANGETIPASSDVDVMVVLDREHAAKPGKLLHHGVLLEITFLDAGLFTSPETILGNYHLAASFVQPGILMDPSGSLAALQRVVAAEYPRRERVEARVADAAAKVAAGLDGFTADGFLPQQVMGWIFPTGVLTHVLLVAGLRNPTVRRRYEAVHDLLREFDREDAYPPLLDVLGARFLTRDQVSRHLEPLAAVFDVAARVRDATFPFASDISPLARPIAIDGSRELVEQGSHREAAFWMVVTWTRALVILRHAGGDAAVAPWLGAFHDLIGEIGICDGRDLPDRAQRSLDLLPFVESVAAGIIARHPAISA